MPTDNALSLKTVRSIKSAGEALRLVEVPDVPTVWPRICHFLEQANAYGRGKFSMHHWMARLLVGQAELLVAPDLTSAVLCDVTMFPQRRVYYVILLGGEGGHDYQGFQRVFEERARALGCDCIEMAGRPGWKPTMKSVGYELAHYVWHKELDDGR